MSSVLVINGPNLNLLGRRETDIYGAATLDEINRKMMDLAGELNLNLTFLQSNIEGEIVDAIQKAPSQFSGIIINPAAYTHSSIAIRDALLAAALPVVEVHLSNIHAREPFRHYSYIADIVSGRIMGFGPLSYMLAVRAIHTLIQQAANEDHDQRKVGKGSPPDNRS